MNGYEFVAALQEYEEFAKIPVVMITSRNADKHRDKAFETGIAAYLTKPYEDRELISKVKDLIGLT
jgi:CheY-like chemotaxis protein